MKLIKCIITTITFAFAAQQLVAGGHGDGHPILTPLEPKAMEGALHCNVDGRGCV